MYSSTCSVLQPFSNGSVSVGLFAAIFFLQHKTYLLQGACLAATLKISRAGCSTRYVVGSRQIPLATSVNARSLTRLTAMEKIPLPRRGGGEEAHHHHHQKVGPIMCITSVVTQQR